MKKQGMLALTFVNNADYDKVRQDDTIDILGLEDFAPNQNLRIALYHADGTTESFDIKHTYNAQQIECYHSGSALNKIRKDLGVTA